MTNREIAEKIAQLFASKDPNGEWWGHDTTLGDVPGEIERALDEKDKQIQRLVEALELYSSGDDCFCVDGSPDQPPSKTKCLYCMAVEALAPFQKPRTEGEDFEQEGSKGCKHQEKLDDGYCPRCHSGMYPSI